jgi:hypothetical protein
MSSCGVEPDLPSLSTPPHSSCARLLSSSPPGESVVTRVTVPERAVLRRDTIDVSGKEAHLVIPIAVAELHLSIRRCDFREALWARDLRIGGLNATTLRLLIGDSMLGIIFTTISCDWAPNWSAIDCAAIGTFRAADEVCLGKTWSR